MSESESALQALPSDRWRGISRARCPSLKHRPLSTRTPESGHGFNDNRFATHTSNDVGEWDNRNGRPLASIRLKSSRIALPQDSAKIGPESRICSERKVCGTANRRSCRAPARPRRAVMPLPHTAPRGDSGRRPAGSCGRQRPERRLDVRKSAEPDPVAAWRRPSDKQLATTHSSPPTQGHDAPTCTAMTHSPSKRLRAPRTPPFAPDYGANGRGTPLRNAAEVCNGLGCFFRKNCARVSFESLSTGARLCPVGHCKAVRIYGSENLKKLSSTGEIC
jgi:hypothetical protein